MKPVIGGVHHRGGISTPQIDAVGWRIGSDLSLMVISRQGCVCWDSCTAGLGHSVGALVSHRRGRTHGHGCWRLGITFIFLQAASPKGRLTGMALRAVQWGCEQQQQGTPRRQGHPQPFSPGEEKQIPALSCAEQM